MLPQVHKRGDRNIDINNKYVILLPSAGRCELTDTKQFVAWLLLVGVIIVGGGNAVGAAVVLALPEPLPELSPVTGDAVIRNWSYPREYQQRWMLFDLDREVRGIELRAAAAAGMVDWCDHRYRFDSVETSSGTDIGFW